MERLFEVAFHANKTFFTTILTLRFNKSTVCHLHLVGQDFCFDKKQNWPQWDGEWGVATVGEGQWSDQWPQTTRNKSMAWYTLTATKSQQMCRNHTDIIYCQMFYPCFLCLHVYYANYYNKQIIETIQRKHCFLPRYDDWLWLYHDQNVHDGGWGWRLTKICGR